MNETIKDTIKWWENKIGTTICNPNEFMDGVRDCREGNKHRNGMGHDYDRGFCAQYTHEQNLQQLENIRYWQ